MRGLLLYILIPILILPFSCKKSNRIELTINLPLVDTFRVEIYQAVTGEKLYNAMLVNKRKIVLDTIIDDAVSINVFWRRSYVPHSIYKGLRKHEETFGDFSDEFMMQKEVYINTKQSGDLEISLKDSLSQEEVEQRYYNNPVDNNLIAESKGKDFNLFEIYSHLLLQNEKVKRQKLSDLKAQQYEWLNSGNLSEVKKMDSLINSNTWQTSIQAELKEQINRLIEANLNSPVSTYIVFREVYNSDSFTDYKNSFLRLFGEATKNKYYRMLDRKYIENQ